MDKLLRSKLFFSLKSGFIKKLSISVHMVKAFHLLRHVRSVKRLRKKLLFHF